MVKKLTLGGLRKRFEAAKKTLGNNPGKTDAKPKA